MAKACYPGSFDPFTNGHLDVIKRIANLFDEVYIVISNNIKKHYLFHAEERKELILEVVKDFKNVKVVIDDGLVVNFCEKNHIDIIIRGLRNIQDYENEYSLFEFNKDINNKIETLVLFPNRNSRVVSSSAIKELVKYDCDIEKYIPLVIKDKVIKRIKEVL